MSSLLSNETLRGELIIMYLAWLTYGGHRIGLVTKSVSDFMTLPPFPPFASPSFPLIPSICSHLIQFLHMSSFCELHLGYIGQKSPETPTLCFLTTSALFIRPDNPSVHSTHKNLFHLYNIIKTLEIFCCGVVFTCELIFVYDQLSLWNNVFIPTKPLNWLWTLCVNRWQDFTVCIADSAWLQPPESAAFSIIKTPLGVST